MNENIHPNPTGLEFDTSFMLGALQEASLNVGNHK